MSYLHSEKRRKKQLISILLVGFLGINVVLLCIIIQGKLFQSSVVNKELIAQQLYENCSQRGEKGKCYTDLFADIAKKYPLQISEEILHILQGKDTTVEYCHGIAHKIANIEVEKDSKNWLDLFRFVDLNACSRGYFHGVIEGYTRFNPQYVLNEDNIPPLCTDISEKVKERVEKSHAVRICLHAIGHMLLVQEKGEVEKANTICSKLGKEKEYECFVGVFMEFLGRGNLIIHEILPRLQWSEEAVPFITDLCLKQTDKQIIIACWQSTSEMYASISRSADSLHIFCDKAQTYEAKVKCKVQGTGFLGFLFNSSNEDTSSLCFKFQTVAKEYTQCIEMVIQYIRNSTSSNRSNELTLFCEKQNEFAAVCFSYLERIQDKQRSPNLLEERS